MSLGMANCSQKERITTARTLTDRYVKIVTSTGDPMPMISVSISRTSTEVYTLSVTTTKSFTTGSWSAPKVYEAEIPNKSISPSSIQYVPSVSMKVSTPSASDNLNSRNSTGAVENALRNILLISVGGALAGSVAVAALLYRYIIREKCAGR